MKLKTLGFLALATLTTGCATLGVEAASPRPNVVIANEKSPGVLMLGPGVQDDYVIPETGSVRPVPVHAWRRTLEAGFRAAFPTGVPGRKLEIVTADLAFIPAAVGMGGTAAVYATVRFKARVLDASNQEMAALAGTVRAREADLTPSVPAMTDNAGKAVESLYEALTALLAAAP